MQKKSIGILGYDTYDLAIYVSMVLKNLQYNVIVISVTKKSESIFNQQGSCNYYSYKNIQFYKGKTIKSCLEHIPEKSMEKADYVLVLLDSLEDHMVDDFCKLFIVLDNSFYMTEYLKKTIRKLDSIDGIVFRDITDNGISSEFIIKHIIKDDYLCKLYQKGSIYQIGDDIIDREYKISIEYEGITNFKNLSDDFLKAIENIVINISRHDSKSVIKALLKAKEGLIFEHCILEQPKG